MTGVSPWALGPATWLGSRPETWAVARFKQLFEFVGSPREGEVPLLSLTRNGIVERDSSSNEGQLASSYEDYPVVEEGTFVLNPMDLVGGWVARSRMSGRVSGAYFSFRLRAGAVQAGHIPSFFEHVFQAYFRERIFEPFGVGVGRSESGGGRWTLNRETLKHFPVPVPPPEDQRIIAEHLDREIRQIDDLYQQLGELRESVQERFARVVRSLVLGESIKNRLNVSPKFGPVEGIPANWNFDKASRLFRASKGTRGALLTAEYCAQNEGDFPVFSGQTERDGVMGFIDSYEFDSGEDELLFTTTVGAKAMSLRRVGGRFSLSQNCMIIQNRKPEQIDIGFAFHYLSTLFAYKREELSEHMQASFRMGDFYEMWLMFPELEEQKKISRAADAEAKKVADLFSVIDGVKKLLLERKRTVVTEHVLGLEGNTSDGHSH